SKQLESKQKEAADAWIKAGDAQYNIAYNVQGALKYYQRADSIYNGYGRIASVVNNLKNESHLSGAALFIGGISRSGSKLKITYKYFGTSDTVIALKLEQEDTGMTTTINLTVAPATEHYRTAIVSSPFLSNYRGDVNIYEKDELLYTITPRTE
ncbi:MAG: hypothetical protein K2O00_08465, partial [Muribaculaceae bacterium]|nr:hypothetical protein [Muribaculaceae bacterium]